MKYKGLQYILTQMTVQQKHIVYHTRQISFTNQFDFFTTIKFTGEIPTLFPFMMTQKKSIFDEYETAHKQSMNNMPVNIICPSNEMHRLLIILTYYT